MQFPPPLLYEVEVSNWYFGFGVRGASVVLALRENPSAACVRYITCARDLLLLRDRNYKCSPRALAVHFDRICSLVSQDRIARQNEIPTESEIERNPRRLSQFLMYRALLTDALHNAPDGLFEALAGAYLTLDYESELEDVGSFIKTCFVELPHNVAVVPIHDSCRISNIRYATPGESVSCMRKRARRCLIVEEQCDFGIRDETGRDVEDGTRLRLTVEFVVSELAPRESLYSLGVRKVTATLVENKEHQLKQNTIGKVCTWGTARKYVREFTITVFGLTQEGLGRSLSTYRMQPENARYLARRVFANTGSSCGFLRSLLSALLGIPRDKICLTYGCSQAYRRNAHTYDVRRRVLVCDKEIAGTVLCGADVEYEVRGRAKGDRVFLRVSTVHISEFLPVDVDGHVRFLRGDPSPSTESSYFLPLRCEVAFFGTSLLEDTMALLDYNVVEGRLGYTAHSYAARGG
ncbi:hypothetical protein [Candidatus Anaplasma sp. TIGMIC]|uniref:hypothetical protein n=1 Tax=Candidatus Anaplasma sp. TIGMIC TaxID=3020713 RepID=UPI00232CF24A|nr:hypothetical protein [Candidatus Anaplasma sp. TIGMIC]MDB1135555.1 hypothetical protein [Candidatus Anaplasma sp. TIGMIC]